MKSTIKLHGGAVITVDMAPAGRSVWITRTEPDGSRNIVAIPLDHAGIVALALENLPAEIVITSEPPLMVRGEPWPRGGELSEAERRLARGFAGSLQP